MESEVTELNEGMARMKLQLKEKELEIKALKEQNEWYSIKYLLIIRMEKNIEEQQSLALTYSTVLKEKEKSLKVKEELALQFFDLINEVNTN